MVLGFNLRDSLRNKRDLTTTVSRNDRLEELIDLIKERYVDTVNTNKLYEDAVAGILAPLDPHTVYINSDNLQQVNEELDGGFSGIGVEFSIVRDTVDITSVIDNGPAMRAGLKTGDQILKVGDSIVAGNGITSERIVSLLRGKQRSTVSVTVKHALGHTARIASIIRDNIPIYSVDAGIMLDKQTGYIKINKFAATTYQEFEKSLKALKAAGATEMVIDLRDNPGGYMDAATQIADDLLDGEKLIVYTKGRNSPTQQYMTGSGKGLFEDGRLAVLVDESSASASEILSGAIQDWDRGVILGRRTYGKGLVQEQYEMPDGSALRLTIARYYTPSGRCIQRSFADGRDAYEADFEKRYEAGELTGNDKNTPADTTEYFTHNKRIVYGGGGIKPDVYVPYDTSRWSTPIISLAHSEKLQNAVWDYYLQNQKQLHYTDINDYIEHFTGSDRILEMYLASLSADKQKQAAKLLQQPGNREYFAQQINAQMGRYLFKDNGYYSVKARYDNVIQKALSVLHSDTYNTLLSKQ